MLAELTVAALLPGWSARHRRRVLGPVMVAAGVLLPLVVAGYTLFSGRNWVALSLDASYLAWVMVTGVVATVARVVAVGEAWLALGRPTPRSRRDAIAIVVVLAVCVPMVVGVVEVGRARGAIAPTFTEVEGPLFDSVATIRPSTATTVPPVPTTTAPVPTTRAAPDDEGAPPSTTTTTSTTSTTTTTLPPLPKRPSSGVDPLLLEDVTTILLLGGDAGPGRSGLRTDTMMLFSIHRPSGRAALISIPRDLKRLLFPPGSALEARYPYGFTNIANAVYPIVSSRRDLREAYTVGDIRPGVVAIAHGIGYSLDVTIDDYVLVDMQGFLELIDALGGVTVDVPKAVPMPGNVPGAPTQYPDVIGPGVIEMDGSTALGYVRSRKGDSDYQRTRRQRQLLAALATQISLDDVVLSFGEVASAIGGTLRTSLTPDELANTLAVIGGETAIVESVGLVPPLVNVRRPNYDQLARIVAEIQLALVTGAPSGY